MWRGLMETSIFIWQNLIIRNYLRNKSRWTPPTAAGVTIHYAHIILLRYFFWDEHRLGQPPAHGAICIVIVIVFVRGLITQYLPIYIIHIMLISTFTVFRKGPAKIYDAVASDAETAGRKGPGKIPPSGSSCHPPFPSSPRSPTPLHDRTHVEAKTRPFSVQRFGIGLIARCPYPYQFPSPAKHWPPPAEQHNNIYYYNILRTRSHILWPILLYDFLLLRYYLLILRFSKDIVIFWYHISEDFFF